MLQVGEGFHVRSLSQATSALPFNVNPLAQLTKATWPYVVPFGVKVSPLAILRFLQSENVQHDLGISMFENTSFIRTTHNNNYSLKT